MRVSPLLSFPVALLYFSSSAFAESSTSARSVADILQDANKMLASGSYVDAARAYGEAIELDPNSYVNYYKRATAYLSLGRHAQALEDFDSILRLNPSFAQAHLQKAKIQAKEGAFKDAEESLDSYAQSGKTDPESAELRSSVKAASLAEKASAKDERAKDWTSCVEHTTKALEIGVNSALIRERRVRCGQQLGDVDGVFGDLTRLSQLNPSSPDLNMQLAHIAYFLIPSYTSTAIASVKQCLFYDPDSRPCAKVHKLLRKLDKETTKARNYIEGGEWRRALAVLQGDGGLIAQLDDALESATAGATPLIPKQFNARKKSPARLELYALACKASIQLGEMSKTKGAKWCEAVFEMDPEHVDGLTGRGERLMKDEAWEEAVRVFEKAFANGGQSSQEALNRLQKAQRLLKQSKAKDYYKVLGVSRDADKRTIKKAYRTAAKKAHPDVGGSEEKMAAINEAYEVLSNDELKARFDQGEDPNDPMAGHGGGGGGHNPFAHHGGGFQQFFQQQQGGQRQYHQKMQFTWG